MTHLVGSLFSGIGGMDAGLARAGFEHAFFCEADPWRREVLAARWPGVPIWDDVRAVGIEPAPRAQDDGRGPSGDGAGRLHADTVLDLLCGGFPCQDVSVAGRRAGLAGNRSGLYFEFTRIIDALRPRWILVENVPGLLSSNGGRDFGVVLGTLADLGYGVAWRILDSRFFGVPQRRRRVFIVGTLAHGDPRAAAGRAGKILAVGSRCPGHPPTGADAREDAAAASTVSTLASSGKSGGWRIGADEAAGGQLVSVSNTLKGQRGRAGGGIGPEETLIAGVAESHSRAADHGDAGVVSSPPQIAAPLTKGSATGEGVNAPGRRQEDDVNIVAYALRSQERNTSQGNGNYVAPPLVSRSSRGHAQGNSPGHNADAVIAFNASGGGEKDLSPRENLANPVTGSNGDPGAIAYALRKDPGGTGQGHNTVRRLTPRECERLQGLPDDWTLLDEKTPDSRRYSALGDAVTANVAEWIGRLVTEFVA